MEMEYKAFPFKLKETNSDEDYFYFNGYAAIFNNIDRGREKIFQGTFKESLMSIPVKILWQHDMSQPLGIPEKIEEDSKGLFVRGKMPKDDSLVRDRVIPQMKVGSVDSLSIGYKVITHFSEKTEKDGLIWNITKANLYEISPVSIPMNPEARITALKTVTGFRNLSLAARNQKWSRKIAIQNIREHTGSKDKPSRSYRNYFMWYDKENATNFTAYKLPYADWIGGDFKAVPRALIAIKAAIGGARGGVDIPEKEKTKILAHVERYLSQLEESEKIFILSDVKNIESREDLNSLLKETGLFSKGAREHISTFIPARGNSDEGESEIMTCFTKNLQNLTQQLR